MNDIRRAILLEMLNEIEALAFPEEVERFAMGAKTALQTFENSWEKFKKFGSNLQEMIEQAKNFSLEDIKILLEKNPAALACLGLDTLSLVDYTGIADMVQGFVLFSQGEILWGTLSLLSGAAQGYIAITTKGTATPIWIALKKGVILSAKAFSKAAWKEIIQTLVSNAPKLLEFLNLSSFGKRFYNTVKSFISKLASYKNIDEAVEYLKQFSPKNIFTPDVKKKILESALLITQIKLYQSGIGAAHSIALEAEYTSRLPEIKELYMRKVFCKQNKKVEELCDTVITNPVDLSLSSIDDSFIDDYEHYRKIINPLKVLNWYQQVGSKTSL